MQLNLSKYKDKGLVGLENLGNTCFLNSCIQVINNTENIEIIWANDATKLPEVVLEDTMTEVIAAGPAKRGIAKGKIEVEITLSFIDFSLRADLLSRSISIEINNKIIPPAILNEYKEIFKCSKMRLIERSFSNLKKRLFNLFTFFFYKLYFKISCFFIKLF